MAEKEPEKISQKDKISGTEWGMVLGVLLIVDLVQFALDWIGIPFIGNLGTVLNRFIDIGVALGWSTYLYLRGITMETKKIGSIILTFFFEEIPSIDAFPFWTADGAFIYFSVKAEKQVQAVAAVGVAVAAVALAPETGGASLAAEGVVAADVAAEGGAVAEEAAEGVTGVAETVHGAEEGLEMSDAYADEMGQESDARDNQTEPETEHLEEDSGTGDENHDLSDEENDEMGRQSDEQSKENKTPEEEEETSKKKKRESEKGSRESLLGGGQTGKPGEIGGNRNNLDLRGSAAYGERRKKERELGALQNVTDLTMSYKQRKEGRKDNSKIKDDETSLAE
ncbi:MAG: hypothetical protein V4467_02965 [Patescibacteria group bacterium]